MMKLLWLDLETTGLDPEKHTILEVAACVADLERPFEVYRHTDAAIHYDDRSMRGIDPFVVDMHTKNGLWEACRCRGISMTQAEERLIEMIDKVAEDDRENQTTLAGSCVFFDLAFIRKDMPRLAKYLHYRVYDVSAVGIFCRSLGMPKLEWKNTHRAMADVEESIAYARECAAFLSRGFAATRWQRQPHDQNTEKKSGG